MKATGAAYVLVISFLIAFFSIVFPPLVQQTIDFLKQVPETVQNVKDENTTIGSFVYRYNLNDDIDQITNDFSSRIGELRDPAISTAGKIGTTVVSTLVVLVLTFMMLVEGPTWLEKYFAVLKPKHRTHHRKLAKQMYKVVVGYVNGQVIIAAIGGVFAAITIFIASQILNVSVNAIALGGIIALFALLPMIGTIIGSVIVVLACLLVSFPLAVVMAIYFLVYQQIENVTIQPYVQSKTNTLTPLLVLIAALLGVGVGGLLGALLAIPTAGCIKIVLDDYFQRKYGVAPVVTSEDVQNPTD